MTPSGSGMTGGAGQSPGRGVPEIIDNRYRIRRLLGRGGQADVYLAYDDRLAIEVAIKFLHSDTHSEFTQRFAHEAQLIARLDSTNIVRIFDFNPSYPYLVLEYCGDGDLNQLLSSRRPLPLPRIVELVKQILAALTIAHEQAESILHRDLKPGNVLFKGNVPKVTDFGLAKVMTGASSGMTTTGGLMGTVAYMSPEQVRDASQVDHRTDLWAVGVILYELLTYRTPFEKPGDGLVNVLNRVSNEPIPVPSFEMPEPLWQFVDRCLTKDPGGRYASAREMIQALDQVVAMIPGAAGMVFPPQDALAEVDLIASKLADSFNSGSTDNAWSLIEEMRRVAPGNSLAKYWERRLSDQSVQPAISDVNPSVPSGISTSRTRTAASADQRYLAIEEMLSSRSYAQALAETRLLLGENPRDARAKELRQRATKEEVEFKRKRDEVERRAAAVETNAEKLKIWQDFDAAFPGSPEAQGELAFLAAEVEEERQRALREKSERQAADCVKSNRLHEALKIWDAYLEEHPADHAAAASRNKIHEQLQLQTKKERRRSSLEEASKLQKDGRLKAALSVLDRWLEAEPGDEEFIKQAEALRVQVADHELNRQLDAARRASDEHRQAGDLNEAVQVWRRFQGDHPTNPVAKEQLKALESEIEKSEKQSRARELRELTEDFEARVKRGRFASLRKEGAALEKALSNARQNFDGGIPALRNATALLKETSVAVESSLSESLSARRAALRTRIDRKRELVAGEDAVATSGATAAESALLEAWQSAVAELARPSTPQTSKDPIASVAQKDAALEAAGKQLASERSAALEIARADATREVEAAQTAIDALRSIPSQTSVTTGAETLEGRLPPIQEGLKSHSIARLMRVADEARLVSAESDTARIAALRLIQSELHGAVEQALAMAPRAPNESLAALLTAAAGMIDPDPSDPPTAATMVSTCAELQRLVAEFNEREGGSGEKTRKRWVQVEALRPPGDRTRYDELKKEGAAAIAAKQFATADRCASQLESLAACGELESIWDDLRNACRQLEGPPDEDGAVPGPSDVDSQTLLGDLRVALAGGDLAQVKSAGKSLARAAGSSDDEVELESIPEIGTRVRKLNERLHPELLQRFDEQIAEYERAQSSRRHAESGRLAAAIERSHAALIRPPSGSRAFVVPIAILLLVAGLAIVFLLRPTAGPTVVRLVSPDGEVRITSVQYEGDSWELWDGQSRIDEEGHEWEVDPGSYELQTEDGASIKFEIPGSRFVVIPGQRLNSEELMKTLNPGRQAPDDAPGG